MLQHDPSLPRRCDAHKGWSINAADRVCAALQDTRLIYRHFATLYFIVICDLSESELGILDLIQGANSPTGGQAVRQLSTQVTETVFTPRVPLPALGAVMVETLDRNFESVCELDLIFHSPKVSVACTTRFGIVCASLSHLVSMPAHGSCQHHALECSQTALTMGAHALLASVFVLSLTLPARPPPHQVHSIIDEIVMGGMVLETNCHEVLRSVGEIAKCVPVCPCCLSPHRGRLRRILQAAWDPLPQHKHAWLSGPTLS
jgi:hypothetical protein